MSGIWVDYKTAAIEDQQKFCVSLNRETESLFYDIRMIIDSKVETQPRAWHISKVNRISPNGVARVTLAQDYFNDNTDYIEYNKDNEIIGMWADYFTNGDVLPQNPIDMDTEVYCVVSTTGKPVIKIGDKYKKFTVNFFRAKEEIKYRQGKWSFSIEDPKAKTVLQLHDPSSILDVKYPNPQSTDLKENQIKIKYVGDYTYLDWILVVTFTDDTGRITSDIKIDIARL